MLNRDSLTNVVVNVGQERFRPCGKDETVLVANFDTLHQRYSGWIHIRVSFRSHSDIDPQYHNWPNLFHKSERESIDHTEPHFPPAQRVEALQVGEERRWREPGRRASVPCAA